MNKLLFFLKHWRLPRTMHVTIPADETAVAFTAGQDGLKVGDRIVVHWEERADAD